MSRFGPIARFLPLAFIGISVAFSAESQRFSGDTFKNLKWRHIGPASFGGRVDDAATWMRLMSGCFSCRLRHLGIAAIPFGAYFRGK